MILLILVRKFHEISGKFGKNQYNTHKKIQKINKIITKIYYDITYTINGF